MAPHYFFRFFTVKGYLALKSSNSTSCLRFWLALPHSRLIASALYRGGLNRRVPVPSEKGFPGQEQATRIVEGIDVGTNERNRISGDSQQA